MDDYVLENRPLDSVGFNLNLLSIPDELLEIVLKNLTFDEISRNRMVCRKFDICCQRLLNQGFMQVERFHCQCLRDIKSQLPRRESERRNHQLARHSDILTAIETRLSLLSMTFMKYVDMNLCCFIPGKVIDEIFRVLRFVQCTPTPPRSHEILQELRDISSMAMEHFDENIVPLLKQKIGVTTRTLSLGSSNSGAVAVSPSRSSQSPCTGGTIRREMAKLQLWVRHLTTSTNGNKKKLVDYNEKMAEYKKKLQEQDKQIQEQNQVIAEQCARIAEQDGKISEMNKKVLECVRHVADVFTELNRYREAGVLDKPRIGTPSSSTSSSAFSKSSSAAKLLETKTALLDENEVSTGKPSEKRKLLLDDWNCEDCCKKQKTDDYMIS